MSLIFTKTLGTNLVFEFTPAHTKSKRIKERQQKGPLEGGYFLRKIPTLRTVVLATLHRAFLLALLGLRMGLLSFFPFSLVLI